VYKARFPLLIALGDSSDFSHQGEVNFINNQVDPNTGTLQMRGICPNKDELLVPGAFARVKVRRGPEADALLIPDRAVSRNQDRRYVLVVNDKNIVEYRPVEIGGLFEGMRAITSGLKPEDRVVVDGLQQARPGKEVKPNKIAAASPAPAPSPAPTTSPAAAQAMSAITH
jgi:RND family efflux transporter MFP subunit